MTGQRQCALIDTVLIDLLTGNIGIDYKIIYIYFPFISYVCVLVQYSDDLMDLIQK